jgi:putative membrane protein
LILNTQPNNPENDRYDKIAPSATLLRGFFGGVLMGMANLVPGVSGGTMLVATGVYGQFVHAVARCSTFRFRSGPIILLAIIAAGALMTILFGAGLMSELVQHHRWTMYSVFIGFTLGGVPLLWSIARPMHTTAILGMLTGIVIMAALAISETITNGPLIQHNGAMLLVLTGAIAGAAMVLPGLSGSYLLLILGQYHVILMAVDALRQGNYDLALGVLVPLAIGIGIGIILISNIVASLLKHARQATLGVLLGLLLGSVFGLWPFRAPTVPQIGDFIRGQLLETQDQVDAVNPNHWNNAPFAPTLGIALASLGLLLVGFIISVSISRLGRSSQP